MAKEEWYYLEGRERMGPVTEMEIRKRLVAKMTRMTDMVWREGMDGWTRVGETEEFSEGGKRLSAGGGDFELRSDLGVPVVEMILGAAGGALGGSFYRRVSKALVHLGHVAILISLAFAFLLGLSFTVKGNMGVQGITNGVLLVLGLLAAQFVASRFLRACERGIDDNPSTLTCRPILDGMAAIGLMGALYFISGGIFDLVAIGFSKVRGYQELATGLSYGAMCLCVACAGLNPGVANTEYSENPRDAGDEALGLLAFFSKVSLALAPIVFGFGVLLMAVLLGVHVVGLQGKNDFSTQQAMYLNQSRPIVEGLFWNVVAPARYFLIFLAGWLLIRLVSATLALPGKVDRVAVALGGKDQEDTPPENSGADTKEEK